jgi:hypothetical protein
MLSLQEMSDRMEISILLDTYAGAIDRVDMNLLDQVFTPDAWVDYSAAAEWGGIAGRYPEIRAWLPGVMGKTPGFQHLVANKELEIEGDRGRGRVMCLNPLVLNETDADGRPRCAFLGLWYIDEYVRTPQGWRIASRREEFCFVHNAPKMGAA